MKVIAKRTLHNFGGKYPNSKQQLLAWYQVFDKNTFDSSKAVKSTFGYLILLVITN